MGKKIILTESQFKKYMKNMVKEDTNQQQEFLDTDQVYALLHAMIDNDFMLYFNNGNTYASNSLSSKGEILDSVCHTTPYFNDEHDKIVIYNKNYGYLQMDNLIGDIYKYTS